MRCAAWICRSGRTRSSACWATTARCGCLYWEGRSIENYSVNKARDMGIQTVFQDRALCEQHPIWRNVFMGREIVKKSGLLDLRQMKRRTADLMKNTMGFTSDAIEPDNIVGCMSGGEKQDVAISRALSFNARLIILDEPTTGLSLAETQKVPGFIRKIKQEGRACIFTRTTSTTFFRWSTGSYWWTAARWPTTTGKTKSHWTS